MILADGLIVCLAYNLSKYFVGFARRERFFCEESSQKYVICLYLQGVVA